MNTLDKRLLSLLRTNARMSTTALARELGVSRATVQSHMKMLEEENIIAGYTIEHTRHYENRLLSAHALIKVNQKMSGLIYNGLKKIPEIRTLYSISGSYDLSAVIRAESVEDLNACLDKITNLAGIERTNSHIILETRIAR